MLVEVSVLKRFSMFRRGVFKNIAKPVKTCMFAEVSVCGFSFFLRVVFKNIAKPMKQLLCLRRCVRNKRVFNVSEATAPKPLKTHRCFCGGGKHHETNGLVHSEPANNDMYMVMINSICICP